MIEEVDFSICPYIKDNMWFFTYYDFCDNRKVLRRMYKELKDDAKQFYKWYCYSNIHMDMPFKNKIWDYLNFEERYYEEELLKAKRFYKAR